MKKYFIVGFVAGVILSLTGSAIASTHDFTIQKVEHRANGYVYRFDDPDYKVKCWESNIDGGISCLPWSEVKER